MDLKLLLGCVWIFFDSVEGFEDFDFTDRVFLWPSLPTCEPQTVVAGVWM